MSKTVPSRVQDEAQILIHTGSNDEVKKLASLIKDLAKHVESQPVTSGLKALIDKTARDSMEGR